MSIHTAIGMDAAAIIVLLLRLYTRKILLDARSRADNWIIIFTNMMATVATKMSCLSTLGGTGLHIWDVPKNINVRLASQLSYVQQCLYYPIIQTTKFSILIFYFSLSPNRTFRRFTQAMMVFSIAFLIADMVPEIYQCIPILKTVYGASIPGHCINQTKFHLINNCINIIQDITILCMPIHILWGLKITNRQRILIAIAFCPGLVSIAASAKRLSIWANQPRGTTNRNDADSTWNRVDMYKFSNVEYCAALICASLPHLKPLVAKFIPEYVVEMTRFGRSRQHSSNDNIDINVSGGPGSIAQKNNNNNSNRNRISGFLSINSYGRLGRSFVDGGGGEKKASGKNNYGEGHGSEEFILHSLEGDGKGGIHVQREVKVENLEVKECEGWCEPVIERG